MDRARFQEISHGSPAYAAARELRQDVLRSPLGRVLSAADLAREESQRHFGWFSADGNLLASVSAAPLDSDKVKIRQMAVAAGERGRGFGRALLLAAEKALRRDGFCQAVLHARLEVTGFQAEVRAGDEHATRRSGGAADLRWTADGLQGMLRLHRAQDTS